MAVKFDSISAETTEVTAEPVTGQFYSSNGYTGLSAAWVLWDGETELTEAEAATLTDTKTMYYYSKGSNTYFPFSGYETPETGVTILNKTCTKCGQVAVSDSCTRNYDDGVVTKAATCTTAGVRTYTCSACGDSYTESIEATGHSAGTAVTENYVEATSTTDGSYDSVVYCTVCGEEISRETVTIPAIDTGDDGSHTHSYTSEVTKAATCTTAGVRTYTCSGCGDVYTESIPATGHSYDSGVVTTEATATTDGVRTYTCSECGDTYTEAIPATGGDSGDDGDYGDDGDDGDNPSHTHSYTSKVTKAATCTTAGVRTYTCSGCGDVYTESIPATGRSAGSAVTENVVDATCTANGSYDTVVYCETCGGEISRSTVTVKATGHTAGSAVKENVVEATATTDGSYDSAVYCETCGAEISRETVTVPATGSGAHTHNWASSVTTTATCTTAGVRTYTCSGCGESYTEIILATGHNAGSAVTENYVAATLLKSGSYDSVVYCTLCGEELSRTTVTIPATGSDTGDTGDDSAHTHAYTSSVTREPTCTTDGVRTYTCSCGNTYTERIPETGHSYDSGIVTAAATCTTAGTRTYTCSDCGYSYTESIPATGHSAGTAMKENEVVATYTKDGSYESVVYCETCGAEISRETVTVSAPGGGTRFLFDDVQNDSEYYYDAVYWAYDNGITTGATDTLFSPTEGCTRAQFVTFLWRLAGKPAPTTASCGFTDLDTGEYYYDAVLWAIEKGVTNGTSVTTFSPNDKISRAQAVTMIYRYAGSPSVAELSNAFTDVPASEYYYNAVLWAVSNGITNGTSTVKFSPDDTCDRAMMVTFLYRFAG